MNEPLLSPGVDPKEVVSGVKVIGEQAALAKGHAEKMSKAFDDFGTGLAKKARPGLEQLKSAMVGTVSDMVKQLDYLATENDKMARELAKSGTTAGKGFSKNLNDSLKSGGAEAIATVRAQKQALQAQYEAMTNLGWKVKPAGLASLATSGVSLFNQDKTRLDEAAGNVEAASKKLHGAQLGWTARMQTGSLKIAETLAAASAREGNAQLGWTARMQTGSLKIAETIAAAAQKEHDAKLAWTAKMQTGSLKIAEQVARSARIEAQARSAALVAEARSQSTQAFNDPRGNYSVLGGANNKELVKVTKDLDVGQKSLNQTLTDARFAFRGLAGSVGQVYLSYGNLLPLLAGAAIGRGVSSVVKVGAEVDNALRTIQALSQESAGSVDALNSKLLELARSGPFGPLAVAEAMKTLSLAGLSAVDVGAAIKDVLNFAVAGNTTIQTAADVLTSVGMAFKVGAEGYNYVADVIAKTAAVSKSSVESIGAAFKTASVINSQYGVSLKDVGLGLALLSNVGVQGTAAGTSLRNTYKELLSPTKKAAEAMKELGISAKDSYGNVKPLTTLIKELSDGYDRIGKLKGDAALGHLFGERGSKGPMEALALYREQLTAAGGESTNMLAKLEKDASDAAGFVITSAAQMAMTPLNQMKSVQSALEASMVEVFATVSPLILELSTRLKEIFGSDEFKTALGNIVVGFGNVAVVIAENIRVIGLLVVAYTSLKLAMGVGAILKVIVAEMAAVGAAMTVAATGTGLFSAATGIASVAIGTKLTALAGLARFLPGVGIAVTAVTTAMMLYGLFTDRASASTGEAAKNTSILDFYTKERDRIHEANEALILNISLEELRKQKQIKSLGAAGAAESALAVAKATQELAKAEATLTMTRKGGLLGRMTSELAEADVLYAKAALQQVKEAQAAQARAVEIARNALLDETNIQGNLTELRAKAKREAAGVLVQETETPDAKAVKAAAKFNSALGESTKSLTSYIKLLKLEQSDADKEFANTDAINKRNAAVRGFSTETETAAVRAHELAKAESQYHIDVLNAANAARKILNDPKSTLGAKEQAQETLNATIAELGVKRDLVVVAGALKEADADRAATAKIALDIANHEKATRELEYTAQRDGLSLEKQRNDLALIGVSLTVAQKAEMDRLSAVSAANLDYEIASKEAMIVLQTELNRLVETGATDIEYKGEQAGIAYADAWKAATQKRNLALANADVKAATTTKAEFQKVFDATGGVLADALMLGGSEGAKKVGDYLREELLRKPFKILLQAVLDPISGALTGMVQGAQGGATSAGGGGQLGVASNLAGLWDKLSGGANVAAKAGNWIVNNVANQMIGDFGAGMANTATMQSASMAAQAGGAQLAGVMVGSVLNGMAGYGIAQAISGGYELGSVNKIAGIASMIPGVGPVAGVIGGLITRAFGHGPLQMTGAGTRGTFGADNNFSGTNYANYHRDGGWFSSDENTTDYSAIDPTTVKAWSTAFAGVKGSVAGMAASLGLATDKIDAYSKAVDIAAGTTAEQLTAIFTSMADDMATASAPGLDAFKKIGETSSAALQRLSGSLKTANMWLGTLRNRLFDISLLGAEAASKLADAFGSLDNLASSSKAYYEAFYSESEHAAINTENLTKAMALVGIALPNSKQAFRDVVSGLDLTSESGRNAYAVMLALAPEFDVSAQAADKMAQTTAAAILKAVASTRRMVPALDVTTLKMGDVASGAKTVSMGLSYINAVMGNSSSRVITLGGTIGMLGTGMAQSQVSAALLNDQIGLLQEKSGTARVNFEGLGEALANVDTATFVATVESVFQNLASRIGSVIDNINAERIEVRDAALQIINPTVMSKEQIARGIASIATALPGNGAMVTANSQMAMADAAAAAARRASASAASGYGADLATAQSGLASTIGYYKDLANYFQQTAVGFNGYQIKVNATGANNDAFGYNADSNQLNGWNSTTDATQTGRSYGDFLGDTQRFKDAMAANGTTAKLQGANVALAAAAAAVNKAQSAYTNAINAANAALSGATGAQTDAANAAKRAELDYAAALQTFAIDAGNSVIKLSRLREETVKYYQAQKALADLMGTSAAGLRKSVADYRYGTLTPEQQLTQLQSQFSSAYSMALASQGDGATLAGYGDKLNELLSPLIDKLGETSNTNMIANYLAQAESVASLIEKTIPVDYQTDSLNLLGSIDATLAMLDASSQSAEAIIASAVAAGADRTATGLRTIGEVISGKAIPAFAAGGYHAGGIRLVGEDGPELEVTGPSRIYSASQTHGLLSGGQPATAEMVAELRALRQEVGHLRTEARATAVNTAVMTKQGARAEQEGVLIRSDSDIPVTVYI